MKNLINILIFLLPINALGADYYPSDVHTELIAIMDVQKKILEFAKTNNEQHSKDAGYSINDASINILASLTTLHTLAIIHENMVNKKDKEFVRKQLESNITFYSNECDVAKDDLSARIADVNNLKLTFLGQKLRDSIVNSCNTVRLWK